MANARIGALRVDLGLNSAVFEKGLSLAERRMNRFAKNMQSTADKMQSLGTKLSIGITAPLTAFGVSAAKAAIDAEEMNSAFNVVFGSMANDVRKWAEETGNAIGRSTQEIQRGALAFQELFGKALDQKSAVDMSKQFAVLTQDLASFKNLSNEVAQQKLFSGLAGEAEPLREVGVFLSAAKVEAKALEMGLSGVNNELTEEEKILARAAVIQEELANAQGDAARTASSTANQIKKAQAAYEELSIIVGTKLIPAITPLVSALASAIDWFTKLPEPVQNVAIGFGAVAAAIGPLLIGAGAVVNAVGAIAPIFAKLAPLLSLFPSILTAVGVAFRFMLGPIGLAITAATAIYYAWKNWDKIEPIIKRLYNAVKTWVMDKLNAIWDGVKKRIEAVKGYFYDLYDAVVGNSYVPDMVDGIADQMARLEGVMVKPAASATDRAAQAFEAMAGRVQGILDRLFPEARARLDFQADSDALAELAKRGELSAEAYAEALRRLKREHAETMAQIERDSPDTIQVLPATDIPEMFKEGSVEFNKLLDGMERKAEVATVRIAESFRDMADKTLASFSNLANSIKSGGFLGILESVIGLGFQLGSIGVFGKSVATKLNAPRSFEGGGYTGYAPRSGGLDGKGGFMAMLHPNETVLDHARGQRAPGTQNVQVSVGVDPRTGNLLAFVDGRVATFAGPIAQGGAQLAAANAGRMQTRRVR